MSVWGIPDRFQASAEAAVQRARSEDLVAEIAEALASAGEYVTRIDVQPAQVAVDFSWAAREAARRLGVRVMVDVAVTRVSSDGRTDARVTLAPAPEE